MDILERIRRSLERADGWEPPWLYGFDIKKGSPKAKAVWATLSVEERLAISRHNPYKAERNSEWVKLYRRGLTQALIAELSGAGSRTVEALLADVRKDGQKEEE
jgi:hypothetical protein